MPELIETGDTVIAPPKGFDSFYNKYLNADGIPIIASANVQDEALVRARHTVINMTAMRPDVLAQMVAGRVRVGIIAEEEMTTDLPEYKNLPNPEFANSRSRGRGGRSKNPFCSTAEENLMRKFGADQWYGEDILIHEFAHCMHNIGLRQAIPGFQKRLEKAYDAAIDKGIWGNTYATTNVFEYFAMGVQVWYEITVSTPEYRDGLLDRRLELKVVDPDLYEILSEVFYNNDWRPIPF